MESLLRQGKQVCPFLKRSSPSSLRVLATSVQTTSRGYRVSALQTAATHCPVIGKALAVQQSKRHYVTKTAKAAMLPTHPGLAESASLEETHRAAGVTDLSQGMRLVTPPETNPRYLSSYRRREKGPWIEDRGTQNI
jgi:hypothetical protein